MKDSVVNGVLRVEGSVKGADRGVVYNLLENDPETQVIPPEINLVMLIYGRLVTEITTPDKLLRIQSKRLH